MAPPGSRHKRGCSVSAGWGETAGKRGRKRAASHSSAVQKEAPVLVGLNFEEFG